MLKKIYMGESEIAAFKGITWHAKSDIGLKRTVNEDSFILPDSALLTFDYDCRGVLFAVADGLGGHAGGEIASQMACDILADFYAEQVCHAGKLLPFEAFSDALESAFFDIEIKIRDHARKDKTCEDMGTTLSALLVTETKAIVSHVGDSRIYRLRRKELIQLTPDHNFVQEMIAEGEIRPSDAAKHPLRNMLTQTVGTEEPLYEIFTCLVDVQPDDCFLLCTDGLHGIISDTVILDTLFTGSDPVKTADQLLALALANGGRDNITVIVVQV
jgi:serine/threonine protein phosphatase PrpC